VNRAPVQVEPAHGEGNSAALHIKFTGMIRIAITEAALEAIAQILPEPCAGQARATATLSCGWSS
jgi:hypothetical protein